ncbi:WGR domain-containing protein [Xanthocytophaga flava]|uniref:WGR domain-containing protein n=1 Tax=Xanthocytophaga flava TaxID=3048013 RepID=UPI0028D3BB41|nr:WGR domain-containing protein [Xanthocytophaga flavus]MDJ1466808.1 WGR domain-containing protein [Xanthocytophaga flavus]
MIAYLELPEHTKFYEIRQLANILTTISGRIGTRGRATVKQFTDEKTTLAQFEKIRQKKIKEGYQLRDFPFPFFGAGYGRYFEWAEILVRFVTQPTYEQIEKIIQLAPAPIKPTKDDFTGRMLHAASEQFVNLYIQAAYEGSPFKIEDITPGKAIPYTDKSDLYSATPHALDAFEQDIEGWLLEIQQFCPIEFVFRREDWEAGGTNLSAWHRISLESIPELLEQWQQDPNTYTQSDKEKNLFKHAVSGIFNFGDVEPDTPSERFIDHIFPDVKLKWLFANEDLSEAIAYYQQHKENEGILKACKEVLENLIEEKNYAKVNQLADQMLDTIITDYHFITSKVGKILYAALKVNNQELIDHLIQRLSNQESAQLSPGFHTFSGDCISCDVMNNIGGFAFTLHASNYIEAQRMYEIALDIQPPQPCTKRLEMFCNALWVLQNDNTGLPVNNELNEKFLAKCLPYGPQNPAIFFNAACLYVEMNQLEKATECVQHAIDHQYNNIKSMKNEIQTLAMFAEFRDYPPLKSLLQI